MTDLFVGLPLALPVADVSSWPAGGVALLLVLLVVLVVAAVIANRSGGAVDMQSTVLDAPALSVPTPADGLPRPLVPFAGDREPHDI